MGGERRATDSAPTRYRPRRPSESVLYRCVQEHFETCLAQCREGHDEDAPVPAYVEREFRRDLECGILAHGFARARCGDCGHDFLIAFSCKGRGVCPSCNARRMVATAAHLTDHVLPELPLRQWVLAVPKRLRYFLERDADLQGAALRLFLRAVEACLRAHSTGSSPAARLGAVAFIHGFGASLNAHLHFHCVVIDGVFEPAPANGVVFHAATRIDVNAIADVQACVRRRLLRVFARRDLLPRDDVRAMAQWAHGGSSSVDDSVRIAAADRAGRERLLRYCARPLFALKGLRELNPDRLLYEGTNRSGPRIHRHSYFGVLARTAGHGKFPPRSRAAGDGRTRPLISVGLTAAVAASLPLGARSSTATARLLPVAASRLRTLGNTAAMIWGNATVGVRHRSSYVRRPIVSIHYRFCDLRGLSRQFKLNRRWRRAIVPSPGLLCRNCD